MPTKNNNSEYIERSPPKLVFNWEDWLPYLSEAEATEEQKRQLIETLWSIVVGFVDLGWEVGDALPRADKSCGKDIDLKAVLTAAVVHSKDPANDRFADPNGGGDQTKNGVERSRDKRIASGGLR